MILRQPNWAEDLLTTETPEAGAAEARKPQSEAVLELVRALTDQRLYRDVVLCLRKGLRDARSEFSFMRVRGLNALAKFIASAVNSEKAIELFRDSQSCQDLQVVPVLFEYTLAPKKHVAKTPDALAVADVVTEMESPPSSVEVALALRVLEGCCLLYSACRTTASHHSAVSELLDFFLAGGTSIQSTCLDGLLAVMLDSSSNQKEFERVHGLRKIAEMLRNSHLDPALRLKIAEFVVILISQILPSANRISGQGDALKPAWITKWAHQELVEILGEKSSEVVEDIINADRTTHPDTQQTTMLSYAQKLLHLAS